MRIQTLTLPDGLSPSLGEGLLPLNMTRLGEVVYLAGPNGGGKSRLLRLVSGMIAAHSEAKRVADELGAYRSVVSTKTAKHEVDELNTEISARERRLEFAKCLKIDGAYQPPGVVDLTPTKYQLADPAHSSMRTIRDAAKSAAEPGMREMSKQALALVQAVQTRHFEASHPNTDTSVQERSKAQHDYGRLCAILEALLETRPGRSIDGNATFFGRSGSEGLSAGQAALVQFSALLYAQASALGGLILLLDEPETHLHPAALVHLIDRLLRANPGGQLWVATHSVHLLAQASSDQIWFVEKGGVRHAGKTPERVLESLLGGRESVDRLSYFCGLPAQLATSRFAAECLLPPTTVVTGSDDPQTQQIRVVLASLVRNRPIRVLDFGAGRGRLLNAYESEDERSLSSSIDYFAFEPNPDAAAECIQAIGRFYKPSNRRVFSEIQDIRLNRGSVDVVVMCNVLHEISPDEWIVLFKQRLSPLLRDDGHLLIVEDYELPLGELAHQKGFFLLDTPELHTLFSLNEGDAPIQTQVGRNGRLKAHLIPASTLGKISVTSIIASLKKLADRASCQIQKLRIADPSYANGRKHALWVQLFANAHLALTAYDG